MEILEGEKQLMGKSCGVKIWEHNWVGGWGEGSWSGWLEGCGEVHFERRGGGGSGKDSLERVVGNEKGTNFWEEKWVGGVPLK